MGQVVWPIANLRMFDAIYDDWVELQPMKKEKVSGYLRLKYKYTTKEYMENLDNDKKARDAAELELLATVMKGTEGTPAERSALFAHFLRLEFCDVELVKQASSHFAFVTKDGFLSTQEQIKDFLYRIDQYEEMVRHNHVSFLF